MIQIIPDTNIAKTAGMAYKNTYAFWPEAPAGTTFDPNNLPSSLIKINWGSFLTKTSYSNSHCRCLPSALEVRPRVMCSP